MLDTDLAWAAGFFDGEGSVLINKSPRVGTNWPVYHASLSVVQREILPLEKFESLFGGKINIKFGTIKTGQRITYYNWRVFGSDNVRNILTSMLPYLVVKREQSLVVLEEFLPLVGKQGSKRNLEQVSLMENSYQKLIKIRKDATLKSREESQVYA